ncbi:MAG: DUF6515 family protein [Candidatus Omnitrophota bacterium]
MNKKDFAKKLGVVVVLGLIMILQSTNVFARDRERNEDRGRSREMITVGHQRYSYHDGRFYKPSWFWFDIALFHPPIGAVVSFLPSVHGTLVIGGSTYYHSNNIYYKACPLGYMVVPEPVVSQQVIARQNLSGQRVSIDIPNSNGSYTTVVLIRQGDGYLGPQGEYYPGNPTVEQLKSLYGK